METYATTTFADRLLVLARVPRSTLFGLSMRTGQTVPLRPPIGTVHLAWAAAGQVAAWLTAAGVAPASESAHRHLRVVRAVRERGYSLTAEEEPRRRLRDVLDRVADEPSDPAAHRERDDLLCALAEGDYEVLDPDAADPPPVGEICAPVFDRDGRVAVALGLVAGRPLDPAPRRAMTDRLLRATTRLTALTGGRSPD
jgi:DNA-binding IclR family transcriptional regulator